MKPWERYQQQSSGPWSKYQTSQKEPSFSEYLNMGKNIARETPGIGTIQKSQEAVESGFGRLGDFITQAGPSKNPIMSMIAQSMVPTRFPTPNALNPREAFGYGQVARYAPQIVMSAAAPEAKTPALEGMSRNLAQRALGFSKRFLNTEQARRKAAMAAETALEEGVIPLSGSPQVMMQRARSLASKTGQKLQGMREIAGEQSVQPVVDALEGLKTRFVKGVGGEWKTISKRFDNAINTVKGLRGPTTINTIEEAKKVLADTVNWLTDTPGRAKQMKSIVGTIEGAVEGILRKTGTDMKIYQGAKKTYGAAEAMKMALNNELSSTSGNQLLSMKPVIVATGELAAGNPASALMTALAGQLVKNYGAGSASVILRSLSRANPKFLIANNILQSLIKKRNENINP